MRVGSLWPLCRDEPGPAKPVTFAFFFFFFFVEEEYEGDAGFLSPSSALKADTFQFN